MLSVIAPSALAVQTHGLEASFDGTGSSAGKFTDLDDIALHQSTGDLYAINGRTGSIDKFDESGNPRDFSALGSSSLNVESTCPEFKFPSSGYEGRDAIAVDNSGTSTDGNIYVATDSVDHPPATPGVCAYNSAGDFLWKFTEAGATGLWVDQGGHLWLGDFNEVVGLTHTGSPPEVETGIPDFSAERLALDSHGNFYIRNFYGDTLEWWTAAGQQAQLLPGNAGAVSFDLAQNHLYVTEAGLFQEYTTGEVKIVNGEKQLVMPHLLSTGGEDILTGTSGIAVDEATGDVFVADHAANRVFIFGPVATLAAVTTGPAEDVRRTTATVSGQVDPDGGGPIATCYVEFGLTRSYGSTAQCDQGTPYGTPTAVTAHLTGLEPGKTYHYRLFASDGSGTNYGHDHSLTTPYVSGVSTEAATDVERTSATLNGTLDPDGVATSYYFQWGLTTGYGNSVPVPQPGASAGSTAGAQHLAAQITGLTPATTYHYRLVAENSEGKTIGGDQELRTPTAVKGLATLAPSESAPSRATLNAAFDPDGYDTHYYFEWGHTESYGHVTNELPGADAGSTGGLTHVSAEVIGLEDYTTYHYRVIASNSFGTTVGKDESFLSSPPFAPTVANSEATDVTNHGATLIASIVPGYGPTVFRFQYGESTNYGFRTELSEPIGSDDAPHEVREVIDGLEPGTTYHFRAVGINFSTATLGADHVFTTSDVPRIDVVSVRSSGQYTAALQAQISPAGATTTYHFDYGLDASYGAQTKEVRLSETGNTDQLVEAELTGLHPGSTYHFRVAATNVNGSVVSGDHSLTTTAVSAGPGPTPRHCRRGFALRHGRCVRHRRGDRRHHHKSVEKGGDHG